MADQTDPLASGASTTEGKLTIALVVVGGALEAFAGVLSQASTEHPNVTWIAITSLIVGAGTQVFSVLGYSKNRSLLKSNALVQALASGVPLVIAAVGNAVLKNVKDPATGTASLPAQQLASANLVAAKVAATPTPIDNPQARP